MTDYGHDLLFGSFVTPSSQRPEQTVELALTTERAGLDLVTFQDHPYSPQLLDASTLLAYVAGRTSTVRLAANVASLPLRPPAVLARSAASLDLLSGGRFELGLGAGAFWDGIEAMGGRRLRPGQAVQGLREAIDIIRQLWDTDTRGGVRVQGEIHQVEGAKRGPAPAHDIGIWVGAYKPRMLALVGEIADGWVPSYNYLPNGVADINAGNAAIDAAAIEAGRDPSAIRRLLNIMDVGFGSSGSRLLTGPPRVWIDQLTELALEHGVGAIILAGDDATLLERVGAEVAPAVRQALADERA